MRIDGEWLLFDDGVTRPVIRGLVLTGDGSWLAAEFLVDTGADRTVFSAATLSKLGFKPSFLRNASLDWVAWLTRWSLRLRFGSPARLLDRLTSAVSLPPPLRLMHSTSTFWAVTSRVCSESSLTSLVMSFVCWDSATVTPSRKLEASCS